MTQEEFEAKYVNTIVCGDCLDVMKDWPDGCVDLVLTDPPYGLSFLGNEWDKEIPNWINVGRRISETVVFTTAPTTLWDYPRPDWVAVWYRKHSSSRQANGGFNLWSPIVVYGKVKIPTDLYSTHFGTYWQEHSGIDHPSPKPVELYKWIVNWASKPNDLILDPFCGSGTTCVAAKKLGRRFIGIDISEDYCEIARQHLESVDTGVPVKEARKGQGALFAQP